MGQSVETRAIFFGDPVYRLFGFVLLLVSSGTVAAASREDRTPAQVKDSAPPLISLQVKELPDRSSISTAYPKPGEFWDIELSQSGHTTRLSVEILEFVTVTFVGDEGEKIMPSYCRVRDLKTDTTFVLDLFNTQHTSFTRRLEK